MSDRKLGLFEGYGIEIEYAVVDLQTLEIRPVADELLRLSAGTDGYVCDYEDGVVAWSNELVRHALEIKNNGPVRSLSGVSGDFHESIQRVDKLLENKLGAALLPGGMHPWMNPAVEAELWPHEYGEVYAAYDRIYDCHRHGWANVQSTHLNLSFADEEEFGRLMAAVRLVLPLIPAVAASSPIVEGASTGLLNNRLAFYATNSSLTPAMTGEVIPEPIYDIEGYHERVLGPIQEQLAGVDRDGVLGGREWSNARGAIARFDRNAIEVRLIDAQECPRSDLGVVGGVAGLIRGLVEERWSSVEDQKGCDSRPLVELLQETIEKGHRAVLPRAHAELFGLDGRRGVTAGELWRALGLDAFAGATEDESAFEVCLAEGSLSERMLRFLGPVFERAELRTLVRQLLEGLRANEGFRP